MKPETQKRELHNQTHRQTQRRTNRCISASDSEWQAVSDMARAAGMPISRFILQRVLTPPAAGTIAEQPSLPGPARQEQLRAVLTLMRIAEENMDRRGDTGRLDEIRAEVDQRIDAWTLGF